MKYLKSPHHKLLVKVETNFVFKFRYTVGAAVTVNQLTIMCHAVLLIAVS